MTLDNHYIHFQRSIHIFHRDLRIIDNTSLNKALTQSKEVIPIFIFTPQQIIENEYKSVFSLAFLLESLEDLQKELQKNGSDLLIFYGEQQRVVSFLKKSLLIDAVFENKDYTPFAIKREEEMMKIAHIDSFHYYSYHDALLNEPEKVLKNDGNPYTIFTPYFKEASKREVPIPRTKDLANLMKFSKQEDISKNSIKEILKNSQLDEIMCFQTVDETKEFIDSKTNIFSKKESNLSKKVIKGGRKQALEIVSNIQSKKNYKEQRDFPKLSATTYLSAHNKFGTVSIREVFTKIKEELGQDHELIRQLYWRDFFYQIAYNFEYVFKESFHKKYNSIKWINDDKLFLAWCEGRTGFPIVDAGMRELNQTGYMHNRTRMIVASFLVKDLHIDWRKGEKYFAQKLIDYDPCVNNGSWQWAASTGCDAQPYFRIFNPWLQQKRFDEDCSYIKKWVPELQAIDSDTIHKLYDKNIRIFYDIKNYPTPIVEHDAEKKKAIEMFKKC